ncbi:MAG: hypothetical protein R3B40_14720 [Polyangiales bacterium]
MTAPSTPVAPARDPLHPRPDVHDFDACLSRSAANVAAAKAHALPLFAEGDVHGTVVLAAADAAESARGDHEHLAAVHAALDRAMAALAEARAAVDQAAVRRRLRAGFGDVAALSAEALRAALEEAQLPSLVLHVDRTAQVHVGQGGEARAAGPSHAT